MSFLYNICSPWLVWTTKLYNKTFKITEFGLHECNKDWQSAEAVHKKIFVAEDGFLLGN